MVISLLVLVVLVPATNDENDVAAGGLASHIGIRNSTAFTYIGTSPTNVNLTSHPLIESNAAITPALLGVATTQERDDIIKWARSHDVQDIDNDSDIDEPRQQMGDPLHTQPVVIDYDGKSILFTVTNEGFLHAFDVTDVNNPSESFVFMPQELLGNLDLLMRNPSNSTKVYGLDGGLTIWRQDLNGDGIINSSDGDKVYIYFGMRRGGQHYYALDVSTLTTPKLMWQIGPGSDGFNALGQTWSRPQLLRVKTATGTNPNAFEVVLAFAGGYDPTYQDDKTLINANRSADTKGNAIYMVDPFTGNLLWSVGNNTANNITLANMTNSIPSDIRAIDLNDDSVAERLYIGDTGGRLWRIDLVGVDPDDSDYSNHTLNSHSSAYLLADLGGDGNQNRRFFYPPEIGFTEGNGGQPTLAVAIGSGHRSHPLSNAVINRFYMVEDDHVKQPPATTPAALTDTDLLNISSILNPQQASLDITQGWYLDLLQDGEKNLSSPRMLDGHIMFTTLAPDSSNPADPNSCIPDNENRYYRMVLDNGVPSSDRNSDGTIDLADRSESLSNQEGIPSEPLIPFVPSNDDGPANSRITVGPEVMDEFDNPMQTLFWRRRDHRDL